MNRKQIVIALSAATLSLSAFAASAAPSVHIGDENNLDWLPATKASAPQAPTAAPRRLRPDSGSGRVRCARSPRGQPERAGRVPRSTRA